MTYREFLKAFDEKLCPNTDRVYIYLKWLERYEKFNWGERLSEINFANLDDILPSIDGVYILDSENGEFQDFLKQGRDEVEEDIISILKKTQYEDLAEFLDPYLDSICGHFEMDEVYLEEDDMIPYLVIDLN